MGLESQQPLTRIPLHEQPQEMLSPSIARMALSGGNIVDYSNPFKVNFDMQRVTIDIEAVSIDSLPTEGVQRVASNQKQSLEEFSGWFIPYLQELRINPEITSSRWNMLSSFGLHPESETIAEDVEQFYRNHLDIATVGPSHLRAFAHTFIEHATRDTLDYASVEVVRQQIQSAAFLGVFGDQGRTLVENYIMTSAYIEDPAGRAILNSNASRSILLPLSSDQTAAFTELYEAQISIKDEEIKKEVFDRSVNRNPAEALRLVSDVRQIWEKQREASRDTNGVSKLGATEKEIKESPYKDEVIQDGKVLRLAPGGELYVYGDGHGDFESWESFLREIDYFKKALKGEIKVVLTGDIFDKGAAQVQLFESILKVIKWNNEIGRNTVFVVQGDHDKSGAVTTSDYASQFFAAYSRQSETLLELVSGQKANFPVERYMRYKLGIAPDVKKVNGLPVEGKGSIIEFVQARLVAYMRKEPRPELPQKITTDQKGYLSGAVKKISTALAENTGLYKEEFKLIDDCAPQVVIDPSGVVIVHGGSAYVESLNDLKNNQDALAATMWGDLSLFTSTSFNKAERLTYITALLEKHPELTATDSIDYEESVSGLKQTYKIEKQQLEKAKQIIEASGSYGFNPERASAEFGQLGAVLINAVLYSETEAREFLTAILGEGSYGVLARGHEMIGDKKVIDQLLTEYHGLVGWTHAAGKGSRDSGMPSERYYLHFPDTSQSIKEITKDNVKKIQ